jgi:hypothetical protein
MDKPEGPTPEERCKRDAMDLAKLIYDLYYESLVKTQE